MSNDVFVQTVDVEVELDRRLRRGDALIVEARQPVRDGELIVVENADGAWVGRWGQSGEMLLYPLRVRGEPVRVQCDRVDVRGVVIGVRSAL
jgi:SOS-response transcriptional repressor LexA